MDTQTPPSPSAGAAGSPELTADLIARCRAGVVAADALVAAMAASLTERLGPDGPTGNALNTHQALAHGYAWAETYGAAVREMTDRAERLLGEGQGGPLEAAILELAVGEYLAQLTGGIALSQVETVRPAAFGLTDLTPYLTPEAADLIAAAHAPALWDFLGAAVADAGETGNFGEAGLGEESLMIQDQFRRFAQEVVAPSAHRWHLDDALIPDDVIAQMSEMGVFGLTIPEEFGGVGLGKTAMCTVTEELSRGYIGVGSLGTRSEIAAELIRIGGTDAQKQKYLPEIAAGTILPTAVFTEPDTGSDLASLKTRAVRDGDVYRLNGAKTWITHASRSDLMTVLARTNPDEPGHRGLSMFLIEKPRGTDADLFPIDGLSGGEIRVLGYRGMKEYELGFDGVTIPADALLGDTEGQGFRQLMATFESARIQTAARAVGVAQNALDLGLAYARQRKQFGRPIVEFPRVYRKLAWIMVEVMIARQLTYFAARAKDEDTRCDIEAGMAKLLAARVAFAAADAALQIHGGNGYALEYEISRVLCDARILNIFEGAAEIQAHVIARGLLARRSK